MTIYRLKISFADNPEIYRLIDIKPEDNLEKLHRTILKSVKFEEGELAAFYVDYGIKKSEIEISLTDMNIEEDKNVLMRNIKVKEYLKNVNDNLTYIYDFLNMWTMDVVLQKKLENPTAGTKYPAIIKSIGASPAQFDSENNLFTENLSEEDLLMLTDLMPSKKNFSGDPSLDDDDLKRIGEEFMNFDEEDDFHDDNYQTGYGRYDDDDY